MTLIIVFYLLYNRLCYCLSAIPKRVLNRQNDLSKILHTLQNNSSPSKTFFFFSSWEFGAVRLTKHTIVTTPTTSCPTCGNNLANVFHIVIKFRHPNSELAWEADINAEKNVMFVCWIVKITSDYLFFKGIDGATASHYIHPSFRRRWLQAMPCWVALRSQSNAWKYFAMCGQELFLKSTKHFPVEL